MSVAASLIFLCYTTIHNHSSFIADAVCKVEVWKSFKACGNLI